MFLYIGMNVPTNERMSILLSTLVRTLETLSISLFALYRPLYPLDTLRTLFERSSILLLLSSVLLILSIESV